MNTNMSKSDHQQFGMSTRALAGLCHHCGLCAFAARKPGSPFEKTMRWHRTWCPAWKAHTSVYGVKPLN